MGESSALHSSQRSAVERRRANCLRKDGVLTAFVSTSETSGMVKVSPTQAGGKCGMLGWIGPRFSKLTPLASLAVRVGLCLTGVLRGPDGASLFRISVTMKIVLS